MKRKWPAMNPPKWPTKNGATKMAAHFATTASLITFQKPATALSAQKSTIISPSLQFRKSTPARGTRFAPIRARIEGDVSEGGGSRRSGGAAARHRDEGGEGSGAGGGAAVSSAAARGTRAAASRITAIRFSASGRGIASPRPLVPLP